MPTWCPGRKNGNDGTLVVAISGSSSSIQNSSGAGSHDAPLHFLQYEKDFTAQQITLEDGSTAYLSILSLDATACAGNQTIVEPFEIDNDAFLSVAPLGGGSLLAAESISSETSRSSKHGSKRAAARPSKFICEFAECAKDFATAHALKVHRRSHTGERPFSCPSEGCNKSFKTSGDLQKHVRTHTGERPFRCPYEGCNKSFSTANIRKVHIRTHTGERPYKCDDCDKSFSNMTNYKNHRRTHTGEKPFTCNVCGRPFAEYSSLYKHKVTHNDGKPYACDLCGRSYRQVSSLSNHRRVCPFANVRLTEAGSNAEDMLAWKLNSNGELVQELLSTVDGQAVAIVCLDDGSDRSGTILIRPTEEEDEEEEEEDDEDAKSDQVIDAQVLTSSEH